MRVRLLCLALTLVVAAAASVGAPSTPTEAVLSPPPVRPSSSALFPASALSSEDLRPLQVAFVPPPPGHGPPADLSAVRFLTPERGFGITWQGSIYVSYDAGTTWQRVFHGRGLRLEQVFFPDARNGFATGLSGCSAVPNCTGPGVLVVTHNGGKTWQVLHPQVPDQIAANPDALAWSYLRFDFVSGGVGYATIDPDMASTGIAAGALFRNLLVTQDGGRKWRALPLPKGTTVTGGISFLSPQRGFVTVTATGTSRWFILETSDGGRTWSTSLASSAPLYTVQFLNPRDGFAAGGVQAKWVPAGPRQILYATGDGGRTWSVRFLRQAEGTEFANLHFLNREDGWATTGVCTPGANWPCAGPLLHTEDGGWSWQVSSAPGLIVHPSFFGSRVWYVSSLPFLAPALLYRTFDGGEHWQNPRSAASFVVNSVVFPDRRTGYLQTNVGVFASRDGGSHWARLSLAPPAQPDDLLVFPGGGVILDLGHTPFLRSQDDGRSWQVLTIPHLPPGGPVPSWDVLDDGTVLLLASETTGPTPVQALYVGLDRGLHWRVIAEPDLPTAAFTVYGRSGAGQVPFGQELSVVTTAGRSLRVAVFPNLFTETSVSFSPRTVWLTGTLPAADRSLSVLLISQDAGRTFRGYLAPGFLPLQVDFPTQDDGWLVLGSQHPGDLFQSHDGGRTWLEVWPDVAAQP